MEGWGKFVRNRECGDWWLEGGKNAEGCQWSQMDVKIGKDSKEKEWRDLQIVTSRLGVDRKVGRAGKKRDNMSVIID